MTLLEKIFQKTSHPTQQIIKEIAKQILLPESKVSIWFKNRRAKEKKSKSGKSPSKLTQQQPSLPSVQFGQSLLPQVHAQQLLVPPAGTQQDNMDEGFKVFVQTVKTEWAKQNRFAKSVSILKPQVLPLIKRAKKNEEAVVLESSDEEVSVLSSATNSKRSAFSTKPLVYNPIQILPKQNLITIPRFITFQTPPQLAERNVTKTEEVKAPVLHEPPDEDVSVLPNPSYKVQEGILKMVFLGLFKEEEFLIQVVTSPALAISDTRDSTSNYTILQDDSLTNLAKNKTFPVIKVTEWNVDDCTINITKLTVVDKLMKIIGNPKPIQESFFNYMKNEKLRRLGVGKGRCNACVGCRKHACRMGSKKTPCTRCEENDPDNCARKKCLNTQGESKTSDDNETLLKEETDGIDDGTTAVVDQEIMDSLSTEENVDTPSNNELPINDYNIKTEVPDDYSELEPTLVIDC